MGTCIQVALKLPHTAQLQVAEPSNYECTGTPNCPVLCSRPSITSLLNSEHAWTLQKRRCLASSIRKRLGEHTLC